LLGVRGCPAWPVDVAELGALAEWKERLICSLCGSREVDMVVTGTERKRSLIPTLRRTAAMA